MERRYVSMDWRDALFAHWPVDVETLRARLPAGIEPRTHDGRAWLGVVAFVMEDIRPRGLPRALGLTFGEANLRTYVTGPDGGEGIYFFNLDAADPLGVGVARWLFRLPYYRASMQVDRTGPAPDRTASRPPHGRTVDFTTHRTHPGVPSAHLDATYGPIGEASIPDPESLEAFLVENYRFYLASGDVGGGDTARERQRIYAGDVAHTPWPLYDADLELRSTNFFEVNGFTAPDDAPLAHYSPGVRVDADRIRRIR